MQLYWRGMIIFVGAAVTAQQSFASSGPAHIYESAAQHIAEDIKGSPSILQAVTRTGTDRNACRSSALGARMVTMEEQWSRFEVKARVFDFSHLERGGHNFEVGCFQIRYHSDNQAYSFINQIFDPLINKRSASKILGELYVEQDDWAYAEGVPNFRARTQPKQPNKGHPNIHGSLTTNIADLKACSPREAASHAKLEGGRIHYLKSLTPAVPVGQTLLLSGMGD